MTPQEFARSTVTISCLVLTLDAAAERSLPREALLKGIELPASLLERPDARIPLSMYAVIAERILRLSGDPGLGVEVGLRCKLTHHGFLGLGVMSQPTLRAAIEFVERYFVKLCFPLCSGRFHVEGMQGIVDVCSVISGGPTQRYATDVALAGLARVLHHFMAADQLEFWFACPQPDNCARYQAYLPRSRFSMGTNQLRFPAAYLDRPSDTACAMTARLVADHCERELSTLNATDDLPDRCRVLLTRCNGDYPSLDHMAQQLCMSGRTLKRRLRQHRLSYQGLLDDARFGESVRLLKTSKLSIEQIAARLGYSGHANFSRAFRSWAGVPPGAFRDGRSVAAPDPGHGMPAATPVWQEIAHWPDPIEHCLAVR